MFQVSTILPFFTAKLRNPTKKLQSACSLQDKHIIDVILNEALLDVNKQTSCSAQCFNLKKNNNPSIFK